MAVYFDPRHTTRELPSWMKFTRGVFVDNESIAETDVRSEKDVEKSDKKRKGKAPQEVRKKKKSDPLAGLKGVEITEGQYQGKSDTDSDSSDTSLFRQTVDPQASTSKEVERINKMESDL